MRIPSVVSAVLSIASILAVGSALASPADVTFQLPVDLTRIDAGFTSVKVTCEGNSQALRVLRRTAEVVIPVTQGSVVQTVQVLVPLTDADFSNNASGRQATYECRLLAYLEDQRLWAPFVSASARNYPNVMTPVPARITGVFVW